MPVFPAFRQFRALLAGGAIALAGCSTTGNSFNTADLRYLEPGYTTLQEASALLQGEPVNVYRQSDGSAMARWARTNSVLTDAIYFNQELWLAFDPGGYFLRVVKSHNIPHSNLHQDEQRVDAMHAGQVGIAPSPPVAEPAPVSLEQTVQAQPVAIPVHTPDTAVPAAESPFSRTAVSYPLGR